MHACVRVCARANENKNTVHHNSSKLHILYSIFIFIYTYTQLEQELNQQLSREGSILE